MSGGVHVRHGFNRGESQIAAGTNNQTEMLRYRVASDQTILMVIADIAMASEPIDSDGSTATAGFVRLVKNPRGNTVPLILPAVEIEELNITGAPQVDTLEDADAGDTFAIAAVALQSSGPGTGRGGSVYRVTLAPKTKRKLERADTLGLEFNLSNSGQSQAVIAWTAVMTIVTQS